MAIHSIRWKPAEQALVAEKFFALQAENPSLGFGKALLEAQKQALPENRWRPAWCINTKSQVPWLFKDRKPSVPVPAIDEEMEKVNAGLEEVILSSSSGLDSLVEQIAEMFASKIVEAISVKVQDKLAEGMVEQTIKTVLEGKTSVPVQTPTKLKSVLVVGARPGWVSSLQTEFKDRFKVKGWREGDTKQLTQLCKSSDVVLGLTGYMSHSTRGVIDAVTEKSKLLLAAGGLTSASHRLSELG